MQQVHFDSKEETKIWQSVVQILIQWASFMWHLELVKKFGEDRWKISQTHATAVEEVHLCNTSDLNTESRIAFQLQSNCGELTGRWSDSFLQHLLVGTDHLLTSPPLWLPLGGWQPMPNSSLFLPIPTYPPPHSLCFSSAKEFWNWSAAWKRISTQWWGSLG